MENKLTCYLVLQTLALVHQNSGSSNANGNIHRSADTTGTGTDSVQSSTSTVGIATSPADLVTQCKLHCPLQVKLYIIKLKHTYNIKG